MGGFGYGGSYMQPQAGVSGLGGSGGPLAAGAGLSSSSNISSSGRDAIGAGGRAVGGTGVGAGMGMRPPVDRRGGKGVGLGSGIGDDTTPLTDSMIQEHNRQMGVSANKKVGLGDGRHGLLQGNGSG